MPAIFAIVLGGATAWSLFRLLFDGGSDFMDCVRFGLTPDLLSALRGEWAEAEWSELRLFLWGAGTFGCGYGGWALGRWLAS